MDMENNNVYKHDEPSFDLFNVTVRPMLRLGHEGELIVWLKEMGLLRRGIPCKTPSCNGIWMALIKTRSMDKSCWCCSKCSSKVSIRDSSFFINLKCQLKLVVQSIMGWCKQIPLDELSEQIGVNVQSLKKIYDRCSEISSCYIMEHWEDWRLGGPGKVVLIDVFPDGYMNMTDSSDQTTTPTKKKVKRSILCLADLSTIPPRTWLQIINPQPYSEKTPKPRTGMIEDALLLVSRHVRPGSALVANYKARCCSMESVRELEGYASTTSVEMLMKLDTPGKRCLQENLETIWQSVKAITACETVHDYGPNDRLATIALHEFMWRQRFDKTPSQAFQNLLHHISEQYSFKD